MKKLDSLIARFADEVIRILGGATLEELAELLESPRPSPSRAPSVQLAAVTRPPIARIPIAPRRSVRPAADAAPSMPTEPPGVAEITDPERLLRVGGSSNH